MSSISLSFAKNYVQVGDTYSKVPYKKLYKKSDNIHLDKLIENTVLINIKVSSGHTRGTGFYIGKHFSKHLFLTNAHVMNKKECKDAKIKFLKRDTKLGRAECENVLLSLFKKELSDLTLFSVKEEQLNGFLGKGLELDFDYSVNSGDLLIQHGFGIKSLRADSRAQSKLLKFSPQVAMDSDCAIAGPNGLLADFVDQKIKFNIALGCDMTSGDSGSAIMNRSTGKVIGLLWGAGKNPKKKDRISSEELWSSIFGSRDARIWVNMSYAISLKEMLPNLKEFLEL
jgi:hypothetical protein